MDVEFLDGSWMLSTLLLAPLRVKRIYPFKSLENWRNCCSIGKRGGVTRYLRCHYDCSAKINYSKASNCASTLSDNTKVTSRVANDHVYAECSLKIDEKPLWGKKEPSATKENSSTKLSNHGLNTVDICRIILFIEREEKSSDWWRVERGKEKKNRILDDFERNGWKIEAKVARRANVTCFFSQSTLHYSSNNVSAWLTERKDVRWFWRISSRSFDSSKDWKTILICKFHNLI